MQITRSQVPAAPAWERTLWKLCSRTLHLQTRYDTGQNRVFVPSDFQPKFAPMASNPLIESANNPFLDVVPQTNTEPHRASIKSFWIGCVGLALLAFVGALFFNATYSGLVEWLDRRQSWRFGYVRFLLLSNFILPSLVMVSVVPILYWRGGLGTRFAVSLAVAITAMNIVNEPIWDIFSSGSKSLERWIRVGQVSFCWIMLPILFLWTPIRTRPLRLLTGGGFMLLAYCISILPMHGIPDAGNVFCWQALYGAGFCLSILRRHWGSFAVLEASITNDQVSRTSSRSLLELMAISALCIVVTTFWSEGFYRRDNSLPLIAMSAVQGLLVSILCSYYVQTVLNRRNHRWLLLGAIWIGVESAFCISVRLIGLSTRTPFSFIDMLLLTALGSTAITLHLAICVMWLNRCGWQTAKELVRQ